MSWFEYTAWLIFEMSFTETAVPSKSASKSGSCDLDKSCKIAVTQLQGKYVPVDSILTEK